MAAPARNVDDDDREAFLVTEEESRISSSICVVDSELAGRPNLLVWPSHQPFVTQQQLPISSPTVDKSLDRVCLYANYLLTV